MILEGLLTTIDADGSPHLAPMGPHVNGADFPTFVLRPFPLSQTCQNLLRERQGVLHVTDDALLIARAAVGEVSPLPPMRSATSIAGHVLVDCHRYFEFRVTDVDSSEERVRLTARVLFAGRGQREWFGFNRARHAVVEAAILATRVHLLPREQIEAELRVLAAIVQKTGGADEQAAMRLLREHVGSRP
jgi:hypothetical protein